MNKFRVFVYMLTRDASLKQRILCIMRISIFGAFSTGKSVHYTRVNTVSEQVKQNRVHAGFIDHGKKKVLAVEMSCPWTENREKKQEEKTIKYGPLRWELKQHFPGYDIRQHNIIIDVLGG